MNESTVGLERVCGASSGDMECLKRSEWRKPGVGRRSGSKELWSVEWRHGSA
jgi:hypothetical protein